MRTGVLLTGALPPQVREEISLHTGLDTGDVTPTVQSEKDNCDINVIVRRFNVTGQLPVVRLPQYGDFTGLTDYHSAMNAIAEANSAFMALPSSVRSKFMNDPGRFVEFASDPKNLDALREMGLANPLKSDRMVSPDTSEVKENVKDSAGNGAGSGAEASGKGSEKPS